MRVTVYLKPDELTSVLRETCEQRIKWFMATAKVVKMETTGYPITEIEIKFADFADEEPENKEGGKKE